MSTPTRATLEPEPYPASAASDRALAVLSGMAVAVGHGDDADALLAEVATKVRRTLDADRVSVLLIDDAGRLTPAVAVARQQDDSLWQQFRRMPPIALDELTGAREALADGRAVVIEDAASSPLIPSSWQRAFSLASLAIARLTVDESPGGVLVVERTSESVPFTPSNVTLLEGMAALAGVALTRLRRDGDAVRLDRLVTTLAVVRSARTERAVAEHALAAMLDVAKVDHGLLALLNGDAVDVVAVRGAGLPEPGRYSLTTIPDSTLDVCRREWDAGIRRPVGVTTDSGEVVVVPVTLDSQVGAAAVLSMPVAELSSAVAAQVTLVADVVGAALRTIRISDERAWYAEALAADGRSEGSLATTAAVDIARSLLGDVGVQVSQVVVDRATARVVGLPTATDTVARLLARWRRSADTRALTTTLDTETVVALRADGQVVGALVAHAEGWVDSRRLETAARLIARGIETDLARHTRAELERQTVEGDARTAVASRCYRETGQVLALLAEHLNNPLAGEPRTIAATRVLVDQARRLVRDATAALVPTARTTRLRPAIAALADQMFAHGGPDVVVRQGVRIPSLDAAVQVALLRAMRRLLVLLRESRVPAASVHVDIRDRTVEVTLRTDRLLDVVPELTSSGLHGAVNEARGWLHAVGGDVEVVHDPGACRFEMTAPADSRRPERLTPVPTPEDNGEVVPLQSASSHRI